MIYQIFSVRDEAAESFGVPFFCINEPQAIRSFKMLCDDPNSTVHSFPVDFSLYHIGTFYDDSSNILSLDVPRLVIRGSSYVNDSIRDKHINGGKGDD